MRLLVCGSREWTAERHMRYVLEFYANIYRGELTVIEGAARGADAMAGSIARSLGVPVEEYPADWRGKGKAAGPIRNQQMLDTGADLVWAFKDGFDWTFTRGGTEHMVWIARKAGVRGCVSASDGSWTPVP
jgi:hypothetical protein